MRQIPLEAASTQKDNESRQLVCVAFFSAEGDVPAFVTIGRVTRPPCIETIIELRVGVVAA